MTGIALSDQDITVGFALLLSLTIAPRLGTQDLKLQTELVAQLLIWLIRS
jgi:hypothetical protein